MDQLNSVIFSCKTALEKEGFNEAEVNSGINICLYQLDEKLETEKNSGERTRTAAGGGPTLPLQGLCTKPKEKCDPKEPFRSDACYIVGFISGSGV